MNTRSKTASGAAVALVLSLFLFVPPARGQAAPERTAAPMVGVKIYEYSGSFPELFEKWDALGVNTVFVSATLGAVPEFKALAKKNGVTTFLIFPVFFGGPELEKRPDLYAIRADGTRAEDDWVKFACPTREEYRAGKIEELRRAVRDVDPDVLSLDFMRFFVFWEKVYPDRAPSSLPDTCFDASCLAAFAEEMRIAVPADLPDTAAKAAWIRTNRPGEWTEWKCRTILAMVRTLAAEARKVKPSIRINIHTVPWRKDDFGGAGRSIAGQDLVRLGPLVDFVSPMVYHHMVRQTPEWVHAVTLDAYDRTRGRILPSIQVDKAYIEDPYTLDEFKRALDEALKPPSAGVVFWSWDALSKSPERMEAVRALFGRAGVR
jgi:hypothetical protein